jgi:hypothetical protein
MFSSLFSSSAQTQNPQGSATSFSALPSLGQTGQQQQPDVQAICAGVQQRMQAIQSMYSGSFLAFSYVLADSPGQVQQVYNAPYQQGVHHDAGKWHEAKVKNPDSQFAYPLPVYGFNALSERSKQQRAHVNNLVAAADNAKTQISNLKSHTERVILTELTNCEKRNQQLSTQLAKLMLSIELFGLQNCKASVDYGKHRELLEKVEKVNSAIGLLQRKISDLRSAQKQIESLASVSLREVSAALPAAETTAPAGFMTLKESVAKKSQAVYNAVIDRCRAVSAQAMHERLSARSKDHLAELKRGYIGAPGSSESVKFRTMQSFELTINRMLSGALSKEIFSTILEVASMSQAPSQLMHLWNVVAHVCSGPIGTGTKSSIEFLEANFAQEIMGITFDKVSRQMDKKSALYAFCRQRISVRTGDPSWLWFAVYSAFRAGWSSVLTEIALDKSNAVEGLDLVCSILSRIIEGGVIDRDLTKLNAILIGQSGERATDETTIYRRLLVTICKGEYEQIKITQDLPDCNAFDWIWFGLRSVVASPRPEEKLSELRAKIDALPRNHFDESNRVSVYPLISDSLGFSSATSSTAIGSSKSALQLGLMQFLTLDFEKGIQTALKHPNDVFNINDPFHRCALFVSVCLDKFGLMDASHIVLEAAITVAVVQERNTYASAVSGATGKNILDQLARLDKRREKAQVTPTIAYPSLKGQ